MTMFGSGEVKAALGDIADSFDIIIKEKTGSTNADIKELAESGAPGFTVVIAGEQSAGRGRLGRSFWSPPDAGIYMSILIRAKLDTADSLCITTCSAVSVAEAIEDVCGVSAGIKWVNDIYVGGKKVCGILTESSFIERQLDYAVLGIGINVADVGFPDDLIEKAGALNVGLSLRPVLAAQVLSRFYGYYPTMAQKTYMEEYRRRSVLTGKRIEYEKGGSLHTADVVGIDDNAHLLVKDDSGKTTALSSGEVNIKTPVCDIIMPY